MGLTLELKGPCVSRGILGEWACHANHRRAPGSVLLANCGQVVSAVRYYKWKGCWKKTGKKPRELDSGETRRQRHTTAVGKGLRRRQMKTSCKVLLDVDGRTHGKFATLL